MFWLAWWTFYKKNFKSGTHRQTVVELLTFVVKNSLLFLMLQTFYWNSFLKLGIQPKGGMAEREKADCMNKMLLFCLLSIFTFCWQFMTCIKVTFAATPNPRNGLCWIVDCHHEDRRTWAPQLFVVRSHWHKLILINSLRQKLGVVTGVTNVYWPNE